MEGPALVKLGGSLLTDKSRESHFRSATAKRLLREIAGTGPAIVLHGAGSFGHPYAARHRIGRVKVSSAAASEVLAHVMRLHTEVVALALKEGLTPLSVPTPPDGTGTLPGAVDAALKAGFTPILHGTLVRDASLGWRVASADELLSTLAAVVHPKRIVWATDVDGVHAADPKTTPDATLLDVADGKTIASLTDGETLDVTGHMGGKLAHAVRAASHGPTSILNGAVPGRLRAALQGQKVVCTRIEP